MLKKGKARNCLLFQERPAALKHLHYYMSPRGLNTKRCLTGSKAFGALEDVNTQQKGELCCPCPLQEFTQQGCCCDRSDS